MATIKKKLFSNKEQGNSRNTRGTSRPNTTADTHRRHGQIKQRNTSTGYLIVENKLQIANPYPANQFGSKEEYDRIMNEVADKIESGEIPRRTPQVD